MSKTGGKTREETDEGGIEMERGGDAWRKRAGVSSVQEQEEEEEAQKSISDLGPARRRRRAAHQYFNSTVDTSKKEREKKTKKKNARRFHTHLKFMHASSAHEYSSRDEYLSVTPMERLGSSLRLSIIWRPGESHRCTWTWTHSWDIERQETRKKNKISAVVWKERIYVSH